MSSHRSDNNKTQFEKKEEKKFTANDLVETIWEHVVNSSLLNKRFENNDYLLKVVTYAHGDPQVFSNIQGVGEVTTWSKKYRDHGILHYSSRDEEKIKEFFSNFWGINDVDVYGTIIKEKERDICDYFIAIHWKEALKNTDSESVSSHDQENSYVDVYFAISKQGGNVYLNYFVAIPENSLREMYKSLPLPPITAKVNKYTSASNYGSKAMLWNIEKIKLLGNQRLKSELERRMKDYLEKQLNEKNIADSLCELDPKWININFVPYPCVSISSKIMSGEETYLSEYVNTLKRFVSNFGKKVANSVANALKEWATENEVKIRNNSV